MTRRNSPGRKRDSNSPTGKTHGSPGTLYTQSEYEQNPDLDPDKRWLDKMAEALDELNAEDKAKPKEKRAPEAAGW